MEKIFQIPFQMDSNAHERRKTTRGSEKKAHTLRFQKKENGSTVRTILHLQVVVGVAEDGFFKL
jgi:hypothetical protein